MGKTKEMLYSEPFTGHLMDAEYMEWVEYSQQIYIEAYESKQEQIQPINIPLAITTDEFGIYTCREEDN